MNQLDDTTAQTVHGWERAASLTGGLLLLGLGARRGGVLGLLQMGVGGLALLRGISGRCEAKRLLTTAPRQPRHNAPRPERYSHMPMDSEVRSPDFTDAEVSLPDSMPMGIEKSTSHN